MRAMRLILLSIMWVSLDPATPLTQVTSSPSHSGSTVTWASSPSDVSGCHVPPQAQRRLETFHPSSILTLAVYPWMEETTTLDLLPVSVGGSFTLHLAIHEDSCSKFADLPLARIAEDTQTTVNIRTMVSESRLVLQLRHDTYTYCLDVGCGSWIGIRNVCSS